MERNLIDLKPSTMAEFLTTTGISYHLENIIIEASRKLVLVSPYLKTSKTLLERLKDAAGRGTTIQIIYGKKEMKPWEMESLTLELYYVDTCTPSSISMNMQQFSKNDNREIGMLVSKFYNANIYTKAIAETKSLMQSYHILRKTPAINIARSLKEPVLAAGKSN